MSSKTVFNRIKIFLFLFATIFCLLDEGNIYLPMVSNFTLEHSQNKVNNKNYYTIPLKIGSQGIEFNVQVDTSTSTSWVPSSRCENCVLAQKTYNDVFSSTSSPTNSVIKLEDEDGNVEGYEVSDNVRLGSYKLKQYGFIQVTRVADDFRDHYGGKLGLGYKSLLDNKEFNFLEKLKRDSLIVKKIFSINAINDKRGILLIGDLPGKQYNTFCNVTTDLNDVDDMYKESWICHLTHVGVFETNKGIFNKMKYYSELEKNNLVNFDSAYDYIAVPISEKSYIEELLEKANLKCETSKKGEKKEIKNESLRNRIREEEVTITCKTDLNELIKKGLCISFVLQGYAYSIPLDLLFVQSPKNGEMEMLIKYIDNSDAIWTFGYPFMNQFLMIFNMEEGHVGIKKLRKTALPIVSLAQEWNKWNKNQGSSCSVFKFIAIILLIIIALAIILLVYRYIKRKSLNSNGPTFDAGDNKDAVY